MLTGVCVTVIVIRLLFIVTAQCHTKALTELVYFDDQQGYEGGKCLGRVQKANVRFKNSTTDII